jgi:hypothetical protein
MNMLPASFVLCRDIHTLLAASTCAANQTALNRKLRSGVNWQGVLKQKGIKRTGVKQGLPVSSNLQSFLRQRCPTNTGSVTVSVCTLRTLNLRTHLTFQ